MGRIAAVFNVILILVGGIFASGDAWGIAIALWLLMFLDVSDSIIEAIKARAPEEQS